MTSMRNWILGGLLALFALAPASAQDAAAKVVMLTGQATAVGDDGAVRPLAKDDSVYSGDVLNSGPGSYLNLQFSDGAFFLLRPNTRFQIEDYRYTDPAKAAAAPAPAASPAAAPAPTLLSAGPSQEEVTQACTPSKVCRECRASGKKGSASCNACYVRVQNCKTIKQAFAAAKTQPQPAQPAQATAASAPAAAAPASAAPVVTASGTAGSDSSRAFFRLVKGGFRTVSGLIGKVNQDDYRVSTPVATIGIRGTRYGVRICQGECADREEILTRLRAAGRSVGPGETILITTVEEGQIAIQTPTTSQLQVPGGARLIDPTGAITATDTPPSTEQQDQDLEPQACVPVAG